MLEEVQGGVRRCKEVRLSEYSGAIAGGVMEALMIQRIIFVMEALMIQQIILKIRSDQDQHQHQDSLLFLRV